MYFRPHRVMRIVEIADLTSALRFYSKFTPQHNSGLTLAISWQGFKNGISILFD